jgi:hypothetical protein
VPGDTITNRTGSVHLLAPGYFWVEAQRTNGLDSHAFGPLHQDNLYGRVIRVFHVRRVTPASLGKKVGESRSSDRDEWIQPARQRR